MIGAMRDAVPLHEALDADLFGGKAAGLAACLRAGFHVPPGVALRAGARDVGALVEAARAAGLEGQRVAVRSSAAAEDSARNSFAGLLLSVLDVGLDGVPAAAEQVLASARSPQALAYRRARGLSQEAALGLVVQRLVPSEISGVLFTHDPVSGLDEIVVEAALGLGEEVVAGRVTPAGYRLSPDGGVRSHRPAPVGPGDPLDGGHLRALADLAARIDDAFPGGSDVEWAFAGGELWVLQRRPITAFDVRPP